MCAMSHNSGKGNHRAGMLATGALLAAAVGAAWGQPDEPRQFFAHVLQPGNGGAGSRANSVAVGDVNGDGVADIVLGGQFSGGMGAGPTPFLATALCENQQIEGVLYATLPDVGHGGTVNAVTVAANGGNDAVAVCAAGSVYEEGGKPLPAWYLRIDGAIALGVLPEQGDAGGEGLAIMAEWTRAGLIIVVCGKSLHMDGSEQATVWECLLRNGDPNDVLIRATVLEALSMGGETDAAAWLECGEFRAACGSSRDADGTPHAVCWRETDEGWQAPAALTNLPGGDRSRARGAATDGSSNTVMFSGTAENHMGRMVPAVWTVEANGMQSVRGLRLPSQFHQGRANGIIAILIGLLVPGEMSGMNGSVAALWTVTGQGSSVGLNLNAVASELPIGTVLRSAKAILPYVEQDVYVIVGDATDMRGVTHGFVGTMAVE